jgi:uncharacterized iron-regulated protein
MWLRLLSCWFSTRWSSLFLFLFFFLCGVGGPLGCASEQARVAPSSVEDQWQAWQILEAKTGRVMTYSDWLKELARYEIVYLGEEHYNAHHIEAAVRLLSSFLADGIRPAIGMEMFGWDGQVALNQYLADQIPLKSEFLARVQWQSNWGGAYEKYEPLVLLGKDHQVPIYAMNPPKTLIRRVMKLGLAEAQTGEEWKHWGMKPEDIIDDPAYRAKIFDQLRRCHGGGEDKDYQTMYEASMVRDEGMAQTLVALLDRMRREQPGVRTTILSYTGGGHIQYNLPIPSRVARRLSGHILQTTVYLASFDLTRTPEIQELLREHVADYIWLTPMSGQGPVQRCR